MTQVRGASARRDSRRTAIALAVIAVAFGVLPLLGPAAPAGATASPHAARAHFAPLPSGPGGGYWLVASDGGIFSYGSATDFGSTGAIALNKPIVGMAATPDGQGYWLVASDGGIFAFGDAGFHGSTGAIHLNKPIVGMAVTPDGGGYWLVASDGGIFAFGDAAFHGSTGGIALNKPIVGMAATPDGGGYWLVASDGGIFAFGDAAFHGSTGGIALAKPIVGMAATPDGGGYWLVAADGGIFAFGSATFHGSTGGVALAKPIVGMAATGDGRGYWLVASDGGIFAFGDAAFFGSAGGSHLNKPIVGMAVDPFSPVRVTPHRLIQVSCPSTTWCAAVDQNGNAFTYSNGAWSGPVPVSGASEFDGLSCPTTTFCIAVSYLDGYTTYNGTSWSAMVIPKFGGGESSFTGVSCPTTTYCAASDFLSGDIDVYNSGAWTQITSGVSIAGQGMPTVSCLPGLKTCMMVDNYGNYSDTTNGSTWSASKLSGYDPMPGLTYQGVACLASNGQCMVADGNGYAGMGNSTTTWTDFGNIDQSTTFDSLESVACDPTGAICVAIDFDGNALVYTAATKVWSAPIPYDYSAVPTSLSCPSTTWCMAVDSSGYAYQFNPTATG